MADSISLGNLEENHRMSLMHAPLYGLPLPALYLYLPVVEFRIR